MLVAVTESPAGATVQTRSTLGAHLSTMTAARPAETVADRVTSGLGGLPLGRTAEGGR